MVVHVRGGGVREVKIRPVGGRHRGGRRGGGGGGGGVRSGGGGGGGATARGGGAPAHRRAGGGQGATVRIDAEITRGSYRASCCGCPRTALPGNAPYQVGGCGYGWTFQGWQSRILYYTYLAYPYIIVVNTLKDGKPLIIVQIY